MVLYQVKNAWQWALASLVPPERAGKSGRYFAVLNGALEYGSSQPGQPEAADGYLRERARIAGGGAPYTLFGWPQRFS